MVIKLIFQKCDLFYCRIVYFSKLVESNLMFVFKTKNVINCRCWAFSSLARRHHKVSQDIFDDNQRSLKFLFVSKIGSNIILFCNIILSFLCSEMLFIFMCLTVYFFLFGCCHAEISSNAIVSLVCSIHRH